MERGKVKLSKTALWILAIGLFIIVAAVLAALLSSQSSDAKQLDENLTANENLLTKLISEREALDSQFDQMESQLAEAELSYKSSQAKFNKEVLSIEYDEEIFSIADDSDLEVLTLAASEPRNMRVEEITFETTTFELEVRGKLGNILSFIDDLTTSEFFTTATVDMVDLEVPEAGSYESPTAIIRVVVYSYEGE